MVLEKFEYFRGNKKFTIKVKPCISIWSKFSGLMFKKNSPPLLFVFKKNQTLSIHSFFCKSFKAIWLDEKKQITDEKVIKNWRLNFSGFGKYLLEIPIPVEKNFAFD